jgi:two-component system sensor histidine kinase KdpD
MAVSLMAMVFDIWPVLIIATLSALVWNFFFIPPIFTFHVGTPSDALMLLMYFLVALINTVLMSRIRRAEKIARAKQEKQNALKLYNTLFNSLSHELKTPISTILVASDTLNSNDVKLSEEARQQLSKEIETAGLRLQNQIENLLNMSRLESGTIKLNLDWCDLSELVNRTVSKLNSEFPKRSVEISIEDNLPMYKLDGGLIEIILINILRNALIYTSDDAAVKIQISGKKDSCEFIISDNGPGFPKNEIQFAFKKFHRFSNSKTGGTGLGLSIVKGFTEAHDGTIQLENKVTGGSKFTIQIPAESTSLSIFQK